MSPTCSIARERVRRYRGRNMFITKQHYGVIIIVIIIKRGRFTELIPQQKKDYKSVKFVNLQISSLGVFSKECNAFLGMLNDLGFDYKHRKYCIGKITYFVVEIRTGELQKYLAI